MKELRPRIRGLFFDGVTAASRSVEVSLDEKGDIVIRDEEHELQVVLSDCSLSTSMGAAPRLLSLPGGGAVELAARDLSLLFGGADRRQEGALSRWWERGRNSLVVLLVMAIGVIYGLISFVVPVGAKVIAGFVPASWEDSLGQAALSHLEKVLRASELETQYQGKLEHLARVLSQVEGSGEVPRIVLKRGGILGANALAVGRNIIVFTDEMLAMSKRDEELMAVMAHELGHLRRRHMTRSMVERGAVAFFLANFLGDADAISSLIAAAPAMMLNASFSQAAELEADRFAAHLMEKQGFSGNHLIEILSRLEAEHPNDTPPYLSSHPSLAERTTAVAGE